jgi:hypothetical protein
VLRRLDRWVRRRLRAIAWKQWKRGRTRFAELRRRGVGKDLAAQTAGSPRGPWRRATTRPIGNLRPSKPSDGEAPVYKALARSTLHDEIVTLRLVLKTAIRHAWLNHLPDLSPPYRTQGKVVHRPWFSPEE